jgi:hypothetical protein
MTTVSMIDVFGPELLVHGKGLEGDDVVLVGPDGPVVAISRTDRLIKYALPVPNGIYRVKFLGREIYSREIVTPRIDISGLYFINITKTDALDTYYDGPRMIPAPTIRTAFIGA